MENKNGQWLYTFSQDFWNNNVYFETKEECIEEATKEYHRRGLTNSFFRIGQVKKLNIEDSFEVEEILSNIRSYFWDNVGEIAEDYLISVSKEHQEKLKERLSKTITEWMYEFDYHPKSFMHDIINEQVIKL